MVAEKKREADTRRYVGLDPGERVRSKPAVRRILTCQSGAGIVGRPIGPHRPIWPACSNRASARAAGLVGRRGPIGRPTMPAIPYANHEYFLTTRRRSAARRGTAVSALSFSSYSSEI